MKKNTYWFIYVLPLETFLTCRFSNQTANAMSIHGCSIFIFLYLCSIQWMASIVGEVGGSGTNEKRNGGQWQRPFISLHLIERSDSSTSRYILIVVSSIQKNPPADNSMADIPHEIHPQTIINNFMYNNMSSDIIFVKKVIL